MPTFSTVWETLPSVLTLKRELLFFVHTESDLGGGAIALRRASGENIRDIRVIRG
jgi:hypothetical protein